MAKIKIFWPVTVLFLLAAFSEGVPAIDDGNNEYYDADYANVTIEYPPVDNVTIDVNITTVYPPTENVTADVNITTGYTPGPDNVTTEYPPPGNVTTDVNITTVYPPTENVTADVNITTIYTPPPDNVTTEYPPAGNVTTDVNITTIYPPTENVTADVNITTIYTPAPDNVTTEYPPAGNVTTDVNITTIYPPTENVTADTNITTIYTPGPDNVTTEYPPAGNVTTDVNITTVYPPTENVTADTNITTIYTPGPDNVTTEYPPAGNVTTDVNITTIYPPTENVTADANITTIYTPGPGNVTTEVNVTTTPPPSFEMAPPVQIGGLGTLDGIVILDRFASSINAYLRIPYAKPPIDELRFKDPVPAETLGERGDPRIDMPKCMQYFEETQEIVGEEDCLYLNVYVPARNDAVSAPKPVMVFIHGDTFEQGSGRLDQFDPRFLLTEDVILVTMNFRLGILGFFHLDDETLGTPGNAALKDQQLALAWVKAHISNFGGDENNISIFGQGAGAASVHLHILSPRSKGLFNKAIIQSGTAISPWVMGTENNGDKLANELEITTENYEDLLNTLRTKEALEILAAARSVSDGLRIPESPWSPFIGPVIERHGNEEVAFLASDPFSIIESGNYNAVPILIGFTNAEGLGVDKILRVNHDWDGVINDFFNLIPSEFGVQEGSNDAVDLARRIEEFYFNDEQPNEGALEPLVRLFGDIFFAFPALRTALEHSRTSTEPVYFYKFSAETDLNVFRRTDTEAAEIRGASHGDDLGYLFYISNLTPLPLGNDEEIALENVIRTWTTFARTGSPSQQPENQPEESGPEENGQNAEGQPVQFNAPEDEDDLGSNEQWMPFTEEHQHYANIQTNATLPESNPNSESMDFWINVYNEFLRDTGGNASLPSISIVMALCIAAVQFFFNIIP